MINRFACMLTSGILILTLGGCAVTNTSPADATAGESTRSNIVKPSRPASIKHHTDFEFEIAEAVRIPGGVRSDYNAAMSLLAKGDTTAGIAALQAIVGSSPQLTTPHVDLGIAYLKVNQYAQAEASLLHALELSPKHPVAQNEMGVVYRATGRYELARTRFEAALKSFPNYHHAQRNLGVLCDLLLADLDCALNNYLAYQEAFPDEDEVKAWIADVQTRMQTSTVRQLE